MSARAICSTPSAKPVITHHPAVLPSTAEQPVPLVPAVLTAPDFSPPPLSSDLPSRYQAFLSRARNAAEKKALDALWCVTEGANPPRPCVSLGVVLMGVPTLQQLDVRVSLSQLDQAGIIRLVYECDEVWVLPRRPSAADAKNLERLDW